MTSRACLPLALTCGYVEMPWCRLLLFPNVVHGFHGAIDCDVDAKIPGALMSIKDMNTFLWLVWQGGKKTSLV